MATWTPVAGAARSVTSVQTTTDSAPSSASDGMSLYGVTSFVVTFQCDSGQTFASAVGQYDFYLYSEALGTWSLAPGREELVPASAVGKRSFAVTFGVDLARGRCAFIANGVNPSSGGQTLAMEAVFAHGAGVPC